MRLPRRAPREVYRVYDEDEFFARADHDERLLEPSASGIGERRLRRVAGATALLAVSGAVLGLVAIAGLPAPSGTRRRAGTNLLAATGSIAASRASLGQPRREPATSAASGRQSVRESASSRARVPVRRASASPSPSPSVRARAAEPPRRTLASAQTTVIAMSPRGAASEAVAYPPQPLRTMASAAAAQQRSGQAEFGFER